jgi:hypothetical protein
MVEAENKIFVEDYDPVEDPKLIERIVKPYLKDIFKDLKMRAGKSATGLAKSHWMDYCRLPEVVAMRLFAIFDEDNDGVLNEDEFIGNFVKIFISELDVKIKITFDLFDTEKKGAINQENVSFLLKHCNFEEI